MRIRKSAGIFGAHDKNPIDRIPFFVIPLYYKEGDFMAREATLQVRMNADLKEKIETLYREMVCRS